MPWRKDRYEDDLVIMSGNEGRKKNIRSRKFPISSVVLPVVFLFLHQIVLNLMAYLRIFLYARNIGLAGDELMRIFSRPDLFADYLIASNAQSYASIWAMLILIPIYLVYLLLRRRRDPDVLRLQKQSLSTYFESALLITGTLGLIQLWMTFLLLFLETENFFGRALQEYMTQAEMMTSVDGDLRLQIVALVIFVPIAEELLFRGIIQGELSLRFSRKITVIISSIVFAFFHFDLIQGSYVFLAGIILALAYELTKNLFIPIFMHIIFNFIGGGILQRLLRLDDSGSQLMILLLLALIPLAFVILTIWFRRYKKKYDNAYNLNNAAGGEK